MQRGISIIKHLIIGDVAGEVLRSVPSVEAVAGRGLKGDRYYFGCGSFNRPQFDQNVREVTLMSDEAIALCNRRLKTSLVPEDFRRNIIVSGMDLLRLKKKRFRIGQAVLEYARTAPPCRYLDRLLGKELTSGLKGIGGIRATIVTGGAIRVGDTLEVLF